DRLLCPAGNRQSRLFRRAWRVHGVLLGGVVVPCAGRPWRVRGRLPHRLFRHGSGRRAGGTSRLPPVLPHHPAVHRARRGAVLRAFAIQPRRPLSLWALRDRRRKKAAVELLRGVDYFRAAATRQRARRIAVRYARCQPRLLGNRLTVDPRTLTPLVLVRIQVPQPLDSISLFAISQKSEISLNRVGIGILGDPRRFVASSAL